MRCASDCNYAFLSPNSSPPPDDLTFPALFILVATTFAQTATPRIAASLDVWPEGKRAGKGTKELESELARNDGFHRTPVSVVPR